MVWYEPATWSVAALAAALTAAALFILLAGVRLTRVADQLADATRLGEAIFGAVLLGASTSLPGIATSVVTAYAGFPQLAAANALGGIAAQTTFLAVADMTYREANLEHAAASQENLMQAALLSALLAIPLLAMASRELTFLGIHPASIVLFVAYASGARLVHQARAEPLWSPHMTPRTRMDEPASADSRPATRVLWTWFAVLAVLTAAAGYAVARIGVQLVERTPLDQTIVGALFTAVATSLPELVVAIAAVRRGALTLAVGAIIGGNAFDVLFLGFADVAFRGGSIYHAIGIEQVFLLGLTLLLTAVLLLGLLRRERSGFAGIGFESSLVVALYLAAMAVLFWPA